MGVEEMSPRGRDTLESDLSSAIPSTPPSEGSIQTKQSGKEALMSLIGVGLPGRHKIALAHYRRRRSSLASLPVS